MLNAISPKGLEQFDSTQYQVCEQATSPDAMIVRSADMHAMNIPDSVKIIGRAGAGVNNIPIELLTKRGIPVLNTPGANANAVMELVIAGMLLASRHICEAWRYVQELNVNKENFVDEIEKNKKKFVGVELVGKTLGVIGLGNVGVKVANAALGLGMKVIGFDPALSVHKAWELSPNVTHAKDLKTLLSNADFISLHVPLISKTSGMVDDGFFAQMKHHSVLLNFSRHEVVQQEALKNALNTDKLVAYVSDFPSYELHHHPKAIFLPHMGASTKEAEENCAVMIARQIKDFFETGAITDSVNFPSAQPMPLMSATRLAICNQNIPNMVAQITKKLGDHQLNIMYFLNQSRDQIAYNIIDVDQMVSEALLQEIAQIEGIIQVRRIH